MGGTLIGGPPNNETTNREKQNLEKINTLSLFAGRLRECLGKGKLLRVAWGARREKGEADKSEANRANLDRSFDQGWREGCGFLGTLEARRHLYGNVQGLERRRCGCTVSTFFFTAHDVLRETSPHSPNLGRPWEE